ncbi:ATP-binding protein [Rhodococcus sp. UNC363MFTsu5.1]|uniref:ATP-binding protein n=1 Tax=Rhodococcus sp. UNC363MFTsu5.1 TaxID=1449069 RepID=UPI000480A00C|nr:ATP-binding protein [Rhodococcus sp. UNC363MFTsu5.1]
MIAFEPATKDEAKARIALCGPPGSGKTYTGLALAFGLGKRVVVVDTERGTASKYVGVNGWQFDRHNAVRYSPASLVEILGSAAGQSYDVLLLDSWSHYWEGVDGMLEQVDQRAKSGNSFSGWKEARPDERRMIDALLAYPGHVIVTMRSKVEYVVEVDERGKKVPRKVGLKPIQRDGIEYEFDIVGDLDLGNTLTVSKTRMPTLAHAVIDEPGLALAEQVREWLEDGVERPTVAECRDRVLADDHTAASMLALHRELEGQLMLGAPTTNAEGEPTTLRDLVMVRGLALRDAEKAAAAPAEGGA